jgi:hypothetical protein
MRQLFAQLLLLTMDSHLGLVDLILQIVNSLHDAVGLIFELLKEANVLHVIVVHILDHLWLNHSVRDRVGVLDAPFKFHLQLLILE